MEPRVLVLCLLSYIACASAISPPAEIAEVVGKRSSVRVRDNPLIIAVRAAGNGSDEGETDKFRDKRALGLLLSGLAQIFGYTTSPIQIASLPNPNTTAAMTMPAKQTARPAAMNATAPRQQETIRFTGVVNFGNNSDIIGHLQRYERIFHSNATTAAAKMTTPRPPPPPPPPAKLPVDLRTTSVETKPPLLAPFFVKIPLPIAPDLLPIPPPVQDLSYPVSPLVSTVSETSEEAPPVHKEQEMVYRNNEDTERYMVEQKDIYDEKDVQSPASKYTHQLYVDDPRWQKQQEDRYNEVQREQVGHVEQLKEQEDERERGRDDHRHREDEIYERQRYREQEIAQRNREQISNYEPAEGGRPADDENDAEEVDEDSTRDNQQERLPSEPARRPPAKDEPGQTGYADYDDREDEQERPEPPAKYAEVGYNQQLPIGDYFHEGNADEIRDSYGEVLDNKKLEDDRLSGYFSMFKHPYTDAFDSQEEGAPRENSGTAAEAPSADAYDEHLARLEKLRQEYAPPAPQSKYEEYDLNDESEADGADDGQSETARNRASSTKSGRSRAKSNGNRPIDDDDDAKSAKPSRQEIDVSHYAPLIVPVRYVDIDTVDKTAEQTATRPPKYQKPDGNVRSASNDRIVAEDNAAAAVIDGTQLTAQIVSPARPRQLHEEGEQGEHKNFQLWPPPFDYAFDNTEQTNAVLPPATHHHPAQYRPIVTDVAANDAGESAEQPSGYLVVIGDPYQQYPHNIYYVPNEAVRTQDADSQPNAEGTHPQQRFSPLPRANADRHTLVRAYPSLTASSRNETANDGNPRADYYRPREPPVRVPDRYGYIFGERTARAASEQPDERSSLFSTDNWSSKIYPSPPIPLRNIASLSRDARGDSSDRQSSRKQKSARSPTERRNGEREVAATPPRRSSPRRRKPFDDPQSAHDFFGFSKNDYGFDGESEASKAAEVGGGGARQDSPSVPVAPEPAAIAYRHDEGLARRTDEPESDTEKAKVTEYRNKVATLRVSERRRLTPNGPVHHVDFMRNI